VCYRVFGFPARSSARASRTPIQATAAGISTDVAFMFRVTFRRFHPDFAPQPTPLDTHRTPACILCGSCVLQRALTSYIPPRSSTMGPCEGGRGIRAVVPLHAVGTIPLTAIGPRRIQGLEVAPSAAAYAHVRRSSFSHLPSPL
jgi:hypothetical protein